MKDLKPFEWYTIQELSEMVDKRTADALKLKGWVLQSDILMGKVRLIPWNHAASDNTDPREKQWDTVKKDGPVEIRTRRKFGPAPVFDKPAPLVRRTPAARSKSLAARMMLEVQKAGVLPGQNDPRIEQIVGESWKEGEPVTGEMVTTLAAKMLQQAENVKQRADYKRVTRQTTD